MEYMVMKAIDIIGMYIERGKILIRINNGLYYNDIWVCDVHSYYGEDYCKRVR